MEQTLVLNATYEPIKIVDWQRAITLWCRGKVEIIETHDREVRSVSLTFKLPSVVRLLHFVKLRKRPTVPFTRANIYARDNYTCQYCDVQFSPEKLTFDHVVPVAHGGQRGWTNIVTACEPCNRKKGARTPAEAGMRLVHTPRRPLILPRTSVKIAVGIQTPATWFDYLYWNVELER